MPSLFFGMCGPLPDGCPTLETLPELWLHHARRRTAAVLVEEFAGEIEAGQALEAVAQAKRRRGYRDL